MAVPVTFTDVAPTISTTEWSFPAGGTTLTAQTTKGVVQAVIDLANLVAGDVFDFTFYEASSAGGTQRPIWTSRIVGAHDPIVTPPFYVGRGWNLTGVRISGADRVIPCSIRQDVGDVNVSQWLTGTPAALSSSGYLQTMLMRWLTDNAGGTPNALATNRVDASAGAIAASALNLAAIASDARLSLGMMRASTAQAGGAQTITLDAGAVATDRYYVGALVLLTGATGAGQWRRIIDYVGGTKVATVHETWSTNPDATTTFVIQADSDMPELPAHRAVTGTLTATAFSTDLTEATADHWKDAFVSFASGTLKGQVKKVTGYTVAGGVLAFSSGFTGAPANGDAFYIING